MKQEIKRLLKDRYVLYIVLFLAVTNLFGYIVTGNLEAVVFFLIVGFLTTYFSKNMIIVMLVAMLTTNFLVAGKRFGGAVREAMTNTKDAEKNKKDDKEHDKEHENKQGDKQGDKQGSEKHNANLDNTEDVGEIDHAATVEAAYDHIDKLLNSDAIKNMSSDTQRLASRQAELMKQMETLGPMVEQGMKTLEKFGGMDKMTDMIGGLSSIVNKFGGGGNSKRN
jgi:Sec-independent protein translocase protein TatA